MKAIVLALLVSLMATSAFASNHIYCANTDSDFIAGTMEINGEPQTNGTWDYVSVRTNFEFSIKGYTGIIQKSTALVLTKTGWDIILYNILPATGSSESIHLIKKKNDISAQFIDGIRNVTLSCTEIAN